MRMLRRGLDLGRVPLTISPTLPRAGSAGSTRIARTAAVAGVGVRSACRTLILIAVLVAFVRLATVPLDEPVAIRSAVTAMGEPDWQLPSLAFAAAILALAAAVAPFVRPIAGAIDLGPRVRAGVNGLTWGVIVMLAVRFTGSAFSPLPGGHEAFGLLLGTGMAVATTQAHRNSVGNATYRTFNLMAMLLAACCLASMSLTPTGPWWTRNFSTLGTSDDLAAACFNVGVVLSGGGIAVMSLALTRSLALPRFGVRRGALVTMRVLIAAIGLGLMGVGLVPIDAAREVHDAFASTAGAAFGVLVIGARWFARRMPRVVVVVSDVFLALLVAAWLAYAQLSVVNLTVFEIVAFSLVFVWLVLLLVATNELPARRPAADAATLRDLAPARVRPPAILADPARLGSPAFAFAGSVRSQGNAGAVGALLPERS